MIEIIPLKNPLNFKISVPGSKSITNRIFLIAALADGKSTIKNALISDDTKYMIKALQKLGIKIEKKNNNYIIYGQNGIFKNGDFELYLGNAGTATRFLTSAMVIRQGKTIITGNKRMTERPIQDLINGLKQLKIKINSILKTGCPPLKIEGQGSFPAGIVNMSGKKSSQYFSSILLTSPLAKAPITINVTSDLVSKPYLDITIQNMAHFGVTVINDNYQKFKIIPQKYHAQDYNIEGDASAASYFFALAAVTGSTIQILNIPYTSIQGDIKFVNIMKKMGCKIEINQNKLITITGPKILKNLDEINLESMPDAAMTVAICAALALGKSKITGLSTLKIKETDRLIALETELKKIGVPCQAGPDYLEIEGGHNLHGAEIETYNDHRMAMCFAVLGSVIAGIKILNPDCVNKTYPEFWKEFPVKNR